MNWIDYTIFTLVFFAAIFGLSNGPIIQFIRIVCLLISFFTAVFFYGILSNILRGVFVPPTANMLSYFIIFGTALIITYIITDIIKRALDAWNMGIGLRLFGGLLGIIKGIIFCGVIIFGVLSFCSKPTSDKIATSKIATQIGKGMQTMVSLIPESIPNKIRGDEEEIKGNKVPKEAQSTNDEDFKLAQ
ncbi:MAG: CvpA family protein [Candidatus Jettenia sp. CY-1]|nr:MAG: CvpA family protein [Candidatus Jettenia sp. CY-1]